MNGSPEDLADLDRLLRGVRFEPRASLGAEVAGRWRRGERAVEHGRFAPRQVLGLTAAALLLGLGLFTFWWLALRPLGAVTVDRCCQDLDGGGSMDDGLLVVSEYGSAVRRLMIYEDRDGSRTFSAPDTMRFERRGAPVVQGPMTGDHRTIQLCCLDYDGGGPSDDALLIVGRPPDMITMAAIYEHRASPGPLR
jgi:hypothetical protein